MWVYIDESGDAGMVAKPGSTRYFAVASVIFDSESERDGCDQRIDALRRNYGFHRTSLFIFPMPATRRKWRF
jgi:hypothetical protein